MKALSDRIKEAVSTYPGESTAIAAYKRVLFVLENQLDSFEEVWSPRSDAAQFAETRAARTQLVDDITLVEALLAQAEGRAIPTQYVPPRRKPKNGY